MVNLGKCSLAWEVSLCLPVVVSAAMRIAAVVAGCAASVVVEVCQRLPGWAGWLLAVAAKVAVVVAVVVAAAASVLDQAVLVVMHIEQDPVRPLAPLSESCLTRELQVTAP
eukprot:6048250-Amphidinium_carterae.1